MSSHTRPGQLCVACSCSPALQALGSPSLPVCVQMKHQLLALFLMGSFTPRQSPSTPTSHCQTSLHNLTFSLCSPLTPHQLATFHPPHHYSLTHSLSHSLSLSLSLSLSCSVFAHRMMMLVCPSLLQSLPQTTSLTQRLKMQTCLFVLGPPFTGPGPVSAGLGPLFTGLGPLITGPGPHFAGPGPVSAGLVPLFTGPGPVSAGLGPLFIGPGPVSAHSSPHLVQSRPD